MVPVSRPWTLTFLVLFVIVIYVSWNTHVTAVRHSVANSAGSRAKSTLRFLVVLTRHGKRGPHTEYTYPKCPYPSYDAKAWPYGVAQLTKKGRIQMYQLGAKIRSLYNGFLNESYYQEDIRASSTLVDRTLMSAAEFLAGLFPPKGFQVWDKDLLWQPLPIFPNYLDHTLGVPRLSPISPCPLFHDFQNQSLTRFDQENGSKIRDMLRRIQRYTGLDDVTMESTHQQIITVFETLSCMEDEGLPLPSWAKSVYPEPLSNLVASLLAANTIGSPVTIRLLQGQLFQEVVSLMEAKINDSLTPDRRMYYYSGHDYTLLGVQGILGLNSSDARIIKPGSALVLELHQYNQTRNFHFQALYIDGSTNDLEPVDFKISGCDHPCDFNLLKKITEKYYDIKDYSKECHSKSSKRS